MFDDIKLPHPPYLDHVTYHTYILGGTRPSFRAWEFAGWERETMSWKTGCSLHAGLSNAGSCIVKGPGAQTFLQGLVINSLESFPVGTMKHAVMLTDEGLIAAHGIIERQGPEEFHSFAGGPPGPLFPPEALPPGVDILPLENYLFQVSGPTSLQVLERACGQSLRDIKFLHFRTKVTIAGVETEVARIGMSGNLAYELHGPIDEGPAVYEAVRQAGEGLGLERLGWGSYLVNHVEGGFPQVTWTMTMAVPSELWPMVAPLWEVSGSVDPMDMRARCRTPVEVHWHNMARFDHDFPGRAVLEAEVANPKRKTVTLRWNHEDVLDITASLLRKDAPFYKQLDLPYAPQRWPQAHADHVTRGGAAIGWSSGTIYSQYYREFLSMGCVDLDATEVGTEVVVHWGDHGGPIKEVHATVERFPYLDLPRNSDIDVTAL